MHVSERFYRYTKVFADLGTFHDRNERVEGKVGLLYFLTATGGCGTRDHRWIWIGYLSGVAIALRYRSNTLTELSGTMMGSQILRELSDTSDLSGSPCQAQQRALYVGSTGVHVVERGPPLVMEFKKSRQG